MRQFRFSFNIFGIFSRQEFVDECTFAPVIERLRGE
jgi:hypothetical protein